MSRIHEALKRASGAAASRRLAVPFEEEAVTALSGSTIDQYQREGPEPTVVARELVPRGLPPEVVARGLPPPRGREPEVVARGLPPFPEPRRTTEALREGGQPPRGRADADEPATAGDRQGADGAAWGFDASEGLPAGAGIGATPQMVAPSGPNPIAAEQYRRLAAALHELQASRGLATVMVTSALPQDGKTLTAVNLALALAGSYDRRVLLIDADLRRGSVHKVLSVSNQRGLSDVLQGGPQELPIVEVSPRLSVLPAGRASADPLPGLSSDRLPTLLEACVARFDWVIVDTPPAGPTPDAQLLAHLIQAVIFVIRAGATPLPTVERALADIGRECIVGTVLNHVDERRIEAGYYYDQYRSTPDVR